MKSYDFEFDGLRLSDKGYTICKFDSDGVETVSNGSQITFNTFSTMNGIKHELTSSTYEDCLSATFQICKSPCIYGDLEEISIDELRDLMRWLNRKRFHKFKLMDIEYSGFYFEAAFNISKIEINGKIYGLELEMITNRPFALQEDVSFVIESDGNDTVHSFYSKSDDEGYIYPDMEITIEADGDLEIYSITEDRTMRILNCVKGEVITLDYPIIETSVSNHKIQNDFNWIFFRIASSFKNKENKITTSLPCSIKITYSPIIKVGI